jgi:hypothetical protein
VSGVKNKTIRNRGGIMKLTNPCKKCLVKPACMQMCGPFKEYIQFLLKIRSIKEYITKNIVGIVLFIIISLELYALIFI